MQPDVVNESHYHYQTTMGVLSQLIKKKRLI